MAVDVLALCDAGPTERERTLRRASIPLPYILSRLRATQTDGCSTRLHETSAEIFAACIREVCARYTSGLAMPTCSIVSLQQGGQHSRSMGVPSIILCAHTSYPPCLTIPRVLPIVRCSTSYAESMAEKREGQLGPHIGEVMEVQEQTTSVERGKALPSPPRLAPQHPSAHYHPRYHARFHVLQSLFIHSPMLDCLAEGRWPELRALLSTLSPNALDEHADQFT